MTLSEYIDPKRKTKALASATVILEKDDYEVVGTFYVDEYGIEGHLIRIKQFPNYSYTVLEDSRLVLYWSSVKERYTLSVFYLKDKIPL